MPDADTIKTTKPKSLLRSTSLVAFMTFLSRILGFVRDMLIAHLFGAGAGVDAFIVAFKIPQFMRRLFAEGAFSQAFVPVLSEYRETRQDDDVKTLLNHTFGSLATVLSILTVLAVIAAPIIIMLFAPGFGYGTPRFLLATYMLRVTFPYLLLISLTAFSGAILNTYDSFGVPAFTPVLLNVSMIGAALFLAPYFQHPVTALAVGVLIAGFAQLSFQIPFLWRKGLLPKPKINFRDPGVRRILKLMLPALFGVSVAQLSLLLDTLFASFLKVGSVSWLYYSDRLMNFPLGIFGVGIATVILPHLSRKVADNKEKDYSRTIDWALRLVLLVGIPSAIGLGILAGPLLTSLFQYGRFTPEDVAMARQSLWAFSLGVPGFMLVKVLASAFYAKQDIKTPVKIAVVAMFTNMILNFSLIWSLAHAGLALATSITGILNASLLFYFLRKRVGFQARAGWRKYAAQLFFGNVLLIAFLLWQVGDLSVWLAWSWRLRVMHLAMDVVLGMVLYVLSLFVMGLRFADLRLS